MASLEYGLVEAGGTKFMLGIGDAKGNLRATHRIETTRPDETMAAVMDWFRRQQASLSAIGIASFGPLDLDPASPQWGHITRTTKPHWSGTDMAGPLARAFGCPVAIDTDVNGAALAESLWGAGQGQCVSLYLTVGTGIGGGAVIDGRLLHGLGHPEMGHIRVPRHPGDGAFSGICPFHGDCLEGLASGPAIAARWGANLSELADGHPAHDVIAWYLGQAACTLRAIFQPGRIILGGGVMATPGLIDRVRHAAAGSAANYFAGTADGIIVPPGLGDRVGLLGALALVLPLAP